MPEQMFDVDGLVRRLDEGGIDKAIVSDPHIWYGGLDVLDIAQIRVYNEFVAGLADLTGGRVLGMATASPWRGEEHLAEALRGINELGLVGVAIPTSDQGKYLDSVPDDFWEAMADRGTPIFLHPAGSIIGQELMGEYRLGEVCGRPLDTTVTLARAILTGVMERHTLNLLCPHAGGAICTVADRLDFGHELRDYAPLGPWGEVHLPLPPSHYVRQLWLDTVTFGARALRIAVETVGAERVCFGTDGPPVPFAIERHRSYVNEVITEGPQRDAVMGGNAERLFRL
jgi:aminocarboxymuconate-semialdehyde decarboxylase